MCLRHYKMGDKMQQICLLYDVVFRYSHIIRYLEKRVKSRKNLLFALRIKGEIAILAAVFINDNS